MVTPNAFTAEAVISGGVSPEYLKSIREAVKGVNGMRRSTAELTREQRTQQNSIRRIQRNLRRANEELARTDEGSDAARRLTRRIGALNMQLRTAGRNLDEVQRELKAATEEGSRGFDRLRDRVRAARGAFIALAAGGGAALGAMGVAIRETFQDIDELTRITFRAPGIDLSEADTFKRAEGLYKISAESMARSLQTLQREVGEFQTGVDELTAQNLADIGVDIGDLVGLEGLDLLNAGIEALRGLESESERAAAASLLFSTRGGAALTNLSLILDQTGTSTAEFAAQVRSDFSDEQLQRIADAEGAFGELELAVTDLRRAFTLGLSEQLQGVGISLTDATRATSDYLKTNEGAAPILATLAGGLAATGAAGVALGGGLADLGQQSFFALQGFSALRGAGGALGGALPRLAGGFRAAAAGIGAATKASIAFAFTPVGAAIVGITVAVAGLTLGIKWLADRVGGFANLWSITMAGARVALISFVRASTLQLRPIAAVLDFFIERFNQINNIWGGQDIETRVGSIFDRLDAEQGRSQAEFSRRVAAGRADAAAQRRVRANASGGASSAAGAGGDIYAAGAAGGATGAAPAGSAGRGAGAGASGNGGGFQQVRIENITISIEGADGQELDAITDAVATGVSDALASAR